MMHHRYAFPVGRDQTATTPLGSRQTIISYNIIRIILHRIHHSLRSATQTLSTLNENGGKYRIRVNGAEKNIFRPLAG